MYELKWPRQPIRRPFTKPLQTACQMAFHTTSSACQIAFKKSHQTAFTKAPLWLQWLLSIPFKFMHRQCVMSYHVSIFFHTVKYFVFPNVSRFKSQPYYRHLTATPLFGRTDSWGVAFRRRQLSALQTMDMPLDGAKYHWLLNLQTLLRVNEST